MTGRAKILWGMTGSVATIRADGLAAALAPLGEIRAVVTERAKHFLPSLPKDIPVLDDEAEWSRWKNLGDEVLHIELRRWADLFLIAPLTADSLAKMTVGICDSLLLSIVRAWDFSKPLVVAPAMNTKMWEHPVTGEQLRRLRTWGVEVVEPVSKKLACDDVGMGALAPAEEIRDSVLRALSKQSGDL